VDAIVVDRPERTTFTAREIRIWNESGGPVEWTTSGRSDPSGKGGIPSDDDDDDADPIYMRSEYKSPTPGDPPVFRVRNLDPWYHQYDDFDWFLLFFPLNMIRRLAVCTSYNGRQRALTDPRYKWTHDVDTQEMVRWISLLFLMEIVNLPRRDMYWSNQRRGAYVGPGFGAVSGISRRRWNVIFRNLSFEKGPFAESGTSESIWDRVGRLVKYVCRSPVHCMILALPVYVCMYAGPSTRIVCRMPILASTTRSMNHVTYRVISEEP
jgi:hypothetical protein